MVSAGHLKRSRNSSKVLAIGADSIVADSDISDDVAEQEIVIMSVQETIVPKLVAVS